MSHSILLLLVEPFKYYRSELRCHLWKTTSSYHGTNVCGSEADAFKGQCDCRIGVPSNLWLESSQAIVYSVKLLPCGQSDCRYS